VEKVRSTDKDKLVTIVFDSQSGASTAKELEADFGRDGYATDKALIHSKAMRKITSMLATQKILLILTSQMRDKMNAMPFGPQWTTSGGKAIGYHSSMRLHLQPAGNIKDTKTGRVIGIKVKGKVIKNRFGPPLRVADFDIFFDRGIDDHGAMLKSLVELKLIKRAGAWYSFVGEDEKEHKFQSSGFEEFLESDADRKESLYQSFCESYIMSYISTDGEVEVDFSDVME
jgi:recombination protein RecA